MKTRLVFDRHNLRREAGRSDLYQLQKRLQSANGSKCGWRVEFRARASDGQFVGLILAQFLDGIASMIGMHGQHSRRARLGDGRESP